MNVAGFVCSANFVGIDAIHPILRADSGRNIIVEALERICHVGIFFDEPINITDVFVDEVHSFGEGFFGFTCFGMLLTVEDIGFGGFVIAL